MERCHPQTDGPQGEGRRLVTIACGVTNPARIWHEGIATNRGGYFCADDRSLMGSVDSGADGVRFPAPRGKFLGGSWSRGRSRMLLRWLGARACGIADENACVFPVRPREPSDIAL